MNALTYKYTTLHSNHLHCRCTHPFLWIQIPKIPHEYCTIMAILNIQRLATLLLSSLALVSAIPAPGLSRRQGACFSSPSKETGLTETSINLVSVAGDEKDAHWVSAISDDRGGVDVGAWNIDNDHIQVGLSYTPLLGQSSQNFVLTVWDEDGYDEVWRKVFDGQGTYCVTTENLKKSEIQVSLTWA